MRPLADLRRAKVAQREVKRSGGLHTSVIPAKAEIQLLRRDVERRHEQSWIPAFAGMTSVGQRGGVYASFFNQRSSFDQSS
jgi:hypothetical protein